MIISKRKAKKEKLGTNFLERSESRRKEHDYHLNEFETLAFLIFMFYVPVRNHLSFMILFLV